MSIEIDVTAQPISEIAVKLPEASLSITGRRPRAENIVTPIQVNPAVDVVGVPGPAGPPGPEGPTGPMGPTGEPTQSVAYTHVQGVASSTWDITHPLGFRPNVSVVDSAGDEVQGWVRYVTDNTIQILFNAAFSGTAYLS